MALRVEKRDGSAERAVLIGMIVSRRVLGAIADKWDRGMFASQWGSLVGGWCVDFYRKYGRAPGPAIEEIYARWTETGQDRETVRLVESFLSGLSGEYAAHKRAQNPDFVLDRAAELFTRVRLNELREGIESDLEVGDVKKGASRVRAWNAIEIGNDAGIVLEPGIEAVRAALEEVHTESLITYPGAAEKFFEGALVRDAFISFLAKEKGCKSFCLMDMAVRAAEQGRNVAYIEAGDNSQHQLMRRILSRITGRPVRPGSYPHPVSIEHPDESKSPARVEHEIRRERDAMAVDDADHALRQLVKGTSAQFRICCNAARTISVPGIVSTLETWGREGFSPDCVIVDYADILAPIDPRADRREQINDTWIALRGLSQTHHCLVVTATQAKATSYDAWLLRRDHFADDKRKFGQVTGFVGINQTPREQKCGQLRFNWIFQRDLEFSEETCLHTAACLAIGNPFVLSTY